MSSGAKISLMIIAAVLGLLAVYYGLISRSDDPLAANASPASEAAADRQMAAKDTSRDAGSTGGVLTESLNAASPGTEPLNQVVIDPLLAKTETDRVAANAPTNLPGGQAPLGHDPSQARMPDIPGFVPADQPRTLTTPAAVPTKAGSPAKGGAGGSGAEQASLAAYIVKEGDNLWTIAQQWFGDGGKWELIAKANPSINPEQLHVGMKIALPSKDAIRTPAPGTTPGTGTAALGAAPGTGAAATTSLSTNAPVSTAATHTVAAGETLTSIARDVYGDTGKWKIIYDANKTSIGSDPNELKVGMKLTIPPQTPRTAAARN